MQFNAITAYCLFIGYPRSGHSLHGSLLNAHPEAVISHELDALLYIQRGIEREELFNLILERERWFRTAQESRWNDFSYRVPNQWQGRFQQIKVIGDKQGAGSSKRLRKRPQLLEDLRRIVQVPVRIVHIVRNPFDNISTMALREQRSLTEAAKSYFKRAKINGQLIQQQGPSEILTMRHEDFVLQPKVHLRTLVEFVGLKASDDYLSDCASIVFKSPSRSRLKIEWPRELIDMVQSQIGRHSFLQSYSFEN